MNRAVSGFLAGVFLTIAATLVLRLHDAKKTLTPTGQSQEKIRLTTPSLKAAPSTLSEESLPGETGEAANEDLAFLQSQNQALQAQVANLLEWIRKNLPEQKPPETPSIIRPTEGIIVDEAGNLDRKIALQLNLSPTQIEEVNGFLQEARMELEGIRTNRMVMYQSDDDQLFIRVPPFEQEGRAIRNRLVDNLNSVMGIEKFQRFMKSSQEAFDKTHNYFGTARQSLSFKTFTDPDTGKPMIRIVDRYHLPLENGRKTIEVNQGNYTTLPAMYSELVDWSGN